MVKGSVSREVWVMPDGDAAVARPVGPRGEARRRALLDAAARLFVTKGFEKTTLRDLVEAAGGSRATIYELFGDKAGLFRAMMEESNRRVLDHLAAARSPLPAYIASAHHRRTTAQTLNLDIRSRPSKPSRMPMGPPAGI